MLGSRPRHSGSMALPGRLLEEDGRMCPGSVLGQGSTSAFEEGKQELDAWMATRAGPARVAARLIAPRDLEQRQPVQGALQR